MPHRSTPWPTGTPCWIQLLGRDPAATKEFYTGLLGWEAGDGLPETGHYVSATLDGRRVAGLGGRRADADGPAAWLTYLASDDVAATLERVRAAGGTVLSEPTELPGLGTSAVAADPQGHQFGVWEASGHIGCEVYNEPGAPIWNELMTADAEAVLAFYTDVFGYQPQQIGDGERFVYWTLGVDGRPVGGLGRGGGEGAPTGWLTYVAVADTDTALARAVELGATVVDPAEDTDFGRMATFAGPDGERLSVMTPPEGSAQE